VTWEEQDEQPHRATNQERKRLQETRITKMGILVTDIGKSIHQEDKKVMSKQLITKSLKLITKMSQKVISVMKLMCSLLIPT
jgi:metal-dependent HD superfamily phosphatase/phosphodiesterase